MDNVKLPPIAYMLSPVGLSMYSLIWSCRCHVVMIVDMNTNSMGEELWRYARN